METDKPITNYVRIFDYFRKFNIIEFKSVNDPFRIDKDIPKILVYIGGILLAEKEATLENTTFSIVSSRKPVKLFKVYKKHIDMRFIGLIWKRAAGRVANLKTKRGIKKLKEVDQ